jgi:site-specific DNA-methyltransferase (adenine-specific)
MNDWIDRCHFGDCREILPTLPAAVADAIVTDPPYGDTSLVWDRRVDGWIETVGHVLKATASIWVFGSMRSLVPLFDAMERNGFQYSQDIVWQKQNGTGFQNDRFRRVHEHAVLFYRGAWADVYKSPQVTLDAIAKRVRRTAQPTHTGAIGAANYSSEDGGPRLMRSVIAVPNDHGRALHPTQKPVDILDPLIRYSVPPGGCVLDPFMGSGSTALAALRSGRHWIGCELDPACHEMQEIRLQQSELVFETTENSNDN